MHHKPFLYRLLEILPGAAVWTTFALAIILSFRLPLVVIVFIIIFDIYWVFRVLYFGIYLGASWRNYKKNLTIDWFARARALRGYPDIYHLIILPTYKEGIEVVRAGFLSLRRAQYTKEKFIVVLAGEAGDKELFLKNAAHIIREFGNDFLHLLITMHPEGREGEIRGKGSNVHYAGGEAKKLIDALHIPYEHVIVSIFDVDTVVHEQYFAHLAVTYLETPSPERSSYQPIAIYANNIWESPSPVRIAAFGTTFWLMTELSRPERLFTFSSHSMPFRALVDVGFHDPMVVSEDSRIFLQCLLHYNGNYRVTPLYLPVYMNTVRTERYIRSLINLYRQQRRWAYGIENLSYMIWGFLHNRFIPLRKKIAYTFNVAEGMYAWATAPILIFVLGRLPLFVAPQEFKNFALVANTPFTLEFLMTAAMFGVFLSAIFSLFLLPPRPPRIRPHTAVIMALQWLLLPFTFVIFGAIPAIDAQTRLMLGRYLGFWVTEKTR